MKRSLPLSFATVLILLACAAAQRTTQPTKPLTIESLFVEGGVTGRGPETIKWSPDGQKVSFVQRDDSGEHGALYYIDVATGKSAVLVAQEKLATLEPPISKIQDEREKERLERYSVAGYHWAPDSKHILFDSHGQLWLYSLATGTAVQFTTSTGRASDPKFSPDGERVAYLREHDLWVHPTRGTGEKQLTKHDEPKDHDKILNGEVDWVYAEELDVRSNYFWSPDSKQIAFLQMNETQVPTYPIVDWMPVHPKTDTEVYPKAGDPNPTVRVGVVGAGGGKVKWFDVGSPADREYIPRFGWVRPGMIWIEALNRAQSKLDLYFVDVDSGHSQKMLSETSDAWVEVDAIDHFKILGSGDRFTWPSWRDGYVQLYLYSFDKSNPIGAPAKLERQLTKGNFDVDSVEGIDEQSGTVYFIANAGDPRQRQLYALKLDGSEMQQISREPGTHAVSMPDKPGYYVDTFSSRMTPPRMSFCKLGGECTPVWQSRSVEQFSLIEPKSLDVKAADGATTLYGTLLMPPQDVIAAQGGRVPLITNPYGGPGAQNVRDYWGGSNYLFDIIMARQGFAILHVDNRGMSMRGKAFAAALKGKFGEVELADQLAALDQVLTANPQLDGGRVGIWGWSYGGFMTLYAMTHSNRFKAGIAVAPVTDWRLYDSIYTERYMGLPKDNADGYSKSSPANFTANLKGRLMLAHGTSDDNVHMQNTVQMVQALITANKPYDLQLYPQKTHGIAGEAPRTQLFQRIQDQFLHWLK